MSTMKRGRKTLAGLAATGVAIALALGGATAATAQIDSPLIPPGPGTVGTVTVHKFEQGADLGLPANGLEQTVAGDNIAGVTFTAEQIESVTVDGTVYELDLTTNEGWLHAAQLVRQADDTWLYGTEAATVTLGATATENTGTTTYENAVFADLPVGLYLFTETAAPADVTRSAPWVMTVPLTDPVGDGDTVGPNERWNYDIHVYPKNSTTDVTKEVNDANATRIGDAISWTITGDVPLVANPDFDSDADVTVDNLEFHAPTAYVVKDDLDIRLTPAATNPVVVSLLGTGVTLDADDYTIAWADPTPAGAGSELTLTFTQTGLDKLGLAVSQADAPAGVKVQVVLSTIITSLTDGTIGDGIIQNQAQLFPNQPSVENDTPVLSNEPETRWGDIVIQKSDALTASVLAGAQFEVYTTEAEALSQENPVTINGESTFTTDADGRTLISGLRHSNFENGAVLTDEAEWQYYWIVEVASPEGYELLAEPIRVTVTAAQEAVSITDIENVPTNAGFELPLTGGTGTAMLTIGGVLILASVLAVVVIRRRRAEAATA